MPRQRPRALAAVAGVLCVLGAARAGNAHVNGTGSRARVTPRLCCVDDDCTDPTSGCRQMGAGSGHPAQMRSMGGTLASAPCRFRGGQRCVWAAQRHLRAPRARATRAADAIAPTRPRPTLLPPSPPHTRACTHRDCARAPLSVCAALAPHRARVLGRLSPLPARASIAATPGFCVAGLLNDGALASGPEDCFTNTLICGVCGSRAPNNRSCTDSTGCLSGCAAEAARRRGYVHPVPHSSSLSKVGPRFPRDWHWAAGCPCVCVCVCVCSVAAVHSPGHAVAGPRTRWSVSVAAPGAQSI